MCIHVVALSLSAGDVLNITRGPNNNEASFEIDLEPTLMSLLFIDNRTGIRIDDTTMESDDMTNLLVCEAEHIGTSTSTPTIVWIRNGTEVVKDVNHNFEDTGLISTLEITQFALTDAGEYQCIFTDVDADAEIVMSKPFRLDTGNPNIYNSTLFDP